MSYKHIDVWNDGMMGNGNNILRVKHDVYQCGRNIHKLNRNEYI